MDVAEAGAALAVVEPPVLVAAAHPLLLLLRLVA